MATPRKVIDDIARATQLAAIGFRGVKQLLGLHGTGISTAEALLEGIEKILAAVANGVSKQRIAVEDEINKIVRDLAHHDSVADAALAAKFDGGAEPGVTVEPETP